MALSPLVSVLELLSHQEPNGAFLAAPGFAPYRYCWFRDGAFVAYALDRAGQHGGAARFHRWAAGVVLRHRAQVEAVVNARHQGRTPDPRLYLHTRYTARGDEGREPWGNFQLDGYGAWLWALEQHLALAGVAPVAVAPGTAAPKSDLQQAAFAPAAPVTPAAAGPEPDLRHGAALVVDYLAALWDQPCYDPWEEHPERRHVATLAAVYGGLEAARRAGPGLGLGAATLHAAAEAAEAVRNLVLNRGVVKPGPGRLCKWLGEADGRPDAGLLWASVPFGLLEPDHPVMAATAAEIEARLLGGGVRRYPGDGFYGGGEWPVLAAWLGWYWARVGRRDGTLRLLEWIGDQADEEGHLPEQVPGRTTDPSLWRWWCHRWGPPARPLLWSHAMHLVLAMEVGGGVARSAPANRP